MLERDEQDLTELRAIVQENEGRLRELQTRLLELENLVLALHFWPERVPKLPDCIFPAELAHPALAGGSILDL